MTQTHVFDTDDGRRTTDDGSALPPPPASLPTLRAGSPPTGTARGLLAHRIRVHLPVSYVVMMGLLGLAWAVTASMTSTLRATYTHTVDMVDGLSTDVVLRTKLLDDEETVGFAGEFVQNTATMSWSATTSAGTFLSGPESASASYFATVGHERNGAHGGEMVTADGQREQHRSDGLPFHRPVAQTGRQRRRSDRRAERNGNDNESGIPLNPPGDLESCHSGVVHRRDAAANGRATDPAPGRHPVSRRDQKTHAGEQDGRNER